jgi:ADP-ribose pyrophosphatase YjhB (NUDIX family)
MAEEEVSSSRSRDQEKPKACEPFECILDNYNGTTLTAQHYGKIDADTFRVRLKVSLKKWEEEGRRGTWLKIPISMSHLVPVAVELGYVYHHAKPTHLMLTKWLHKEEHNNLPGYAGTYLGVGGLVVNEKGQILTVQERFSPLLKRHWKLPGGLVDPSEHLHQAVIREVEEETGVKTEFVSLLCFRHMHGFRFGCGDIYFVCRLRPVPGTDTTPRPDPQEIHDCRWMDVEEYLAQDLTQTNRMMAESLLKNEGFPVHMVTTACPHYVKGRQDMLCYSLEEKKVTSKV